MTVQKALVTVYDFSSEIGTHADVEARLGICPDFRLIISLTSRGIR